MKRQKVKITTEQDRLDLLNLIKDLDLEHGPFIAIVGKYRKIRTVNQNRWLAAWINLIRENGMTYNDVYIDLLQQCSVYIEAETIKGEKIMVPRSTSQMNTIQFSQFMDNVHIYILEALNIDLPFPNHPNFEDFMFQYDQDDYDNLIENE